MHDDDDDDDDDNDDSNDNNRAVSEKTMDLYSHFEV